MDLVIVLPIIQNCKDDNYAIAFFFIERNVSNSSVTESNLQRKSKREMVGQRRDSVLPEKNGHWYC